MPAPKPPSFDNPTDLARFNYEHTCFTNPNDRCKKCKAEGERSIFHGIEDAVPGERTDLKGVTWIWQDCAVCEHPVEVVKPHSARVLCDRCGIDPLR